MELDIYQIDAFASKPFEGNPAAVVPLKEWISVELMQSIAAENNLAETAFYVLKESNYEIRWFTPEYEVPLCGHATLASAQVIFNQSPNLTHIEFLSESGPLYVERENDLIAMNFPSNPITRCEPPLILEEALNEYTDQCFETANNGRYILVFEHEDQVRNLKPNMAKLKQLSRSLGVTAPSEQYDFVSRFFAPELGIPEDPVTGSFHTNLVPYWSERLGKTELHAKQVSARGGEVFCQMIKNRDAQDRVKMSGNAIEYMRGKIIVPD